MKLLIAIFVLGLVPSFAQTTKPSVPSYNAAAEAMYRGTIADLRNRECPVSGGMGAHIMLKLESGNTIEVHLATTEFTKMAEMNLHKGDSIDVTGWKTEFEGVQTIFAREVKRGNETYVFRAKDGMPAWIY
jgi:TusA-related sulfurtransferase